MGNLLLSEIWIYPIKSLGGIRLSSSRVLEKGLQYDRRWMLIDENNQFITQRVHHRMALFKQRLDVENLMVDYQGESLSIPFDLPLIDEPIESNVWDDKVVVQEVSKDFSRWFSERMAITCRLVAFPESNTRLVDERYRISESHVGLADGYPFLIIGQSSLDDLNSKLVGPVPMNRFRPNLVFTGGQAFEEDDWRNFTVGNNRFIGVKKCARCVLTTVNQETGEAGKEPLRTLAKYRREGEKVLFGQNVIAIDYNEIHEGDTITLH